MKMTADQTLTLLRAKFGSPRAMMAALGLDEAPEGTPEVSAGKAPDDRAMALRVELENLLAGMSLDDADRQRIFDLLDRLAPFDGAGTVADRLPRRAGMAADRRSSALRRFGIDRIVSVPDVRPVARRRTDLGMDADTVKKINEKFPGIARIQSA